MVIAIDRAIIRYSVGAGAIDSIQQTVINDLTAFSLRLVHGKPHEIVTQSLDTLAGEDTEYISLRVRELCRGIATKARQVFA